MALREYSLDTTVSVSSILQAHRHIRGNTDYLTLRAQILGVDDIRPADPAVVLLNELIHRFRCITLGGLYLDGVYLRLRLASAINQEIDINIILQLLPANA